MENNQGTYLGLTSKIELLFKKLTRICNLIIFHIQLADDTTCDVVGETYNSLTERCECGSGLSCTVDTPGTLRIVYTENTDLLFMYRLYRIQILNLS